MKSYNHLMERYLTESNYYLAVQNATARKNNKKKKRKKAKYYRKHADEFKEEIMEYAKNFYNDPHTPIEIYDGVRRKKRVIIVPSMREQIIHHMVINVMKPIFLKGMYEHSYGSIPNRGPHLAKKRLEKWIENDKINTKFCLKLDIKKYFDSIPHDILKNKLAKLIHDEQFLNLLYIIVEASPKEGQGIPIGFYTSQWIANWYLTELDHYIKEQLHAKYYMRYMDDMVIFGAKTSDLYQIKQGIEQYLNEKLGLQLKENWQIFRFDCVDDGGEHHNRDLDFMGFRFYSDKVVLRKTLMLKATRKAKRICNKGFKNVHDCRQLLSYNGWLQISDTYDMYKKRIKPFVNFTNLKKYVSDYERREANVV